MWRFILGGFAEAKCFIRCSLGIFSSLWYLKQRQKLWFKVIFPTKIPGFLCGLSSRERERVLQERVSGKFWSAVIFYFVWETIRVLWFVLSNSIHFSTRAIFNTRCYESFWGNKIVNDSLFTPVVYNSKQKMKILCFMGGGWGGLFCFFFFFTLFLFFCFFSWNRLFRIYIEAKPKKENVVCVSVWDKDCVFAWVWKMPATVWTRCVSWVLERERERERHTCMFEAVTGCWESLRLHAASTELFDSARLWENQKSQVTRTNKVTDVDDKISVLLTVWSCM